MKTVAILTLPAFNEIDSFVALHILNRAEGVRAILAGPEDRAVSMNGVDVAVEGGMDDIAGADAVLIGSGRRSLEFAADPALLPALALDPARQSIASQCSGALFLAAKGLIGTMPVCTDNVTRPHLEAMGVEVTTASLAAEDNVATAGGCLSAPLVATWLLMRLADETAARSALDYVAPVGEREQWREALIGQVRAAMQPRQARAVAAAT